MQKFQMASSLNNSISTPSTFESNQKTVNQIILASFLNQGGEFSSQQVAILKQIASQCQKIGGHAVVQAAALLKNCNAINANLLQNCGDQMIPALDLSGGAEERFSKRQVQASIGSLKAFSANEVLTVIFPEAQPGMLHLFDIKGRECFTHKVTGNEETLEIDISQFISGLYVLSFNGSRNLTSKIIISH